MSLPSSRVGISKRTRSPTLCTRKRPRLVCASAVTTRAYARGAAAPVPRPAPAESALTTPGAWGPAAPVGRAPPVGAGVGGLALLAQPADARAGAPDATRERGRRSI